MREPLTGEAYWNLMKNTADRVDKWPAWKKGEQSLRTTSVCDGEVSQTQPGLLVCAKKGETLTDEDRIAIDGYVKFCQERKRRKAAKLQHLS